MFPIYDGLPVRQWLFPPDDGHSRQKNLQGGESLQGMKNGQNQETHQGQNNHRLTERKKGVVSGQ